jgi:hypothetical protein
LKRGDRVNERKFQLIYIPNTLLIVFALFLMLFSFDMFGEAELSIGEQIIGFLIHSIPSALVILVWLIARKKPLIGAIICVIVYVLFTIFFNTYREVITFMLISFPILLTGVLYLVVHMRKKLKKDT